MGPSNDSPSFNEMSAGRIESSATRTYETLRTLILGGELDGGERLLFEDIAEELDVNRQAVRDAMMRLADESIVVFIPLVGCAVPIFSKRERLDSLTIFAAVENEIVATAVERRTSDDVRVLWSVHRAVERLLAQTPAPRDLIETYRLLNRDFHLAIYASTHSVALRSLGERVLIRAELAFLSTTDPQTTVVPNRMGSFTRLPSVDARAIMEEQTAEHERIVRAIEDGDVGASRTHARAHATSIIALLEQLHTMTIAS